MYYIYLPTFLNFTLMTLPPQSNGKSNIQLGTLGKQVAKRLYRRFSIPVKQTFQLPSFHTSILFASVRTSTSFNTCLLADALKLETSGIFSSELQ